MIFLTPRPPLLMAVFFMGEILRKLLLFLFVLLLPFSANADTCQPGYYKNGNTCSKCTGVTYSDTIDATSCTRCPTATTYASIVTSYYYFKGGDYIQDSNGYCRAMFDVNSIDSTGNYTLTCHFAKGDYGIGGDDSSSCMAGQVTSCAGGRYAPYSNPGANVKWAPSVAEMVGTVCVDAGVGYYSPAGDLNRYECTNKPQNSTYTGSGTNNDCSWVCDAGYYKNGNSCSQCTGATYSDTTDATSCTPCPTATVYASRVTGYYYWSSDGMHRSVFGCRAGITEQDPTGDYELSCGYANGDYGTGGGSDTTCMATSLTSCASGRYAVYDPGSTTNHWEASVAAMEGAFCADVGIGYYSPDGDKQRYACTNKPSNSSYTGGASSNSCPWTCDSGYGLYNGVCHARCPYGDGELHVGQYTHPLWADITNVPSPSVYIGELGPNHDGLCYAYLEPDDTPVDNHHGFHTVHNGVPYHAINLGLYGLE